MSLYYHNSICNKCGGDCELDITQTISNQIAECHTRCKYCGFVDFWAYGFFKSSQDGYRMAREDTHIPLQRYHKSLQRVNERKESLKYDDKEKPFV